MWSSWKRLDAWTYKNKCERVSLLHWSVCLLLGLFSACFQVFVPGPPPRNYLLLFLQVLCSCSGEKIAENSKQDVNREHFHNFRDFCMYCSMASLSCSFHFPSISPCSDMYFPLLSFYLCTAWVRSTFQGKYEFHTAFLKKQWKFWEP